LDEQLLQTTSLGATGDVVPTPPGWNVRKADFQLRMPLEDGSSVFHEADEAIPVGLHQDGLLVVVGMRAGKNTQLLFLTSLNLNYFLKKCLFSEIAL